MQVALAAAPTGAAVTAPTTRATRLMAAGVALAGAGVIAVNPIAPLAPVAGSHHAAVELTATTGENLEGIFDLLTGPNPIFSALGELGSYYGQTVNNSIDGVMNGLEIMWSGGGQVKGLEVILPQIMEFIQQGDLTSAWNLVNWDWLFNMNNIFQPLFDHVVRGTTDVVPGVFGIGADMTNVWAAVQEIFGDFDFWKSTAKYMLEPLTGFAFALSENLSGLPDGVDHVTQSPLDALLNGYITWNSETGEDTGQWWGLLTERGTLSYFLDFLPGKIADALTSTIPDVDVGSAASDVSLLDVGAADSSLLDLSGALDGLFS